MLLEGAMDLGSSCNGGDKELEPCRLVTIGARVGYNLKGYETVLSQDFPTANVFDANPD